MPAVRMFVSNRRCGVQVAGVSGDVRRVLQLCRKASEVCEEHGCSQVTIRAFEEASNVATACS